MTIVSGSGGTLTIPDYPNLSVPLTPEGRAVFADWQQACVEAIKAQGFSAWWVHDQLCVGWSAEVGEVAERANKDTRGLDVSRN